MSFRQAQYSGFQSQIKQHLLTALAINVESVIMKLALIISSVLLFCYICASLLLYLYQRDFLYFPTPKYQHSFERFSLASEGEKLEIIMLNKGNAKALIYFGGNAEAVVANAEEFSSNFSESTTYLVNYRGYGGSTGRPSEAGNYADALAVYDHVKKDHSQISVAGRSLGSGVATYLAAHRPVENVALITPYDSILNIAKANYSLFPVKLLLKDVYDSASRAKTIQSKVLVIAAENDVVIPMLNTQKLVDAFRDDQVQLKVIKNTGHNDVSNSAEYFKALREFL